MEASADPATGKEGGTAARPRPPALWDPIVRLTHWGIPLGVILNVTLAEDADTAHVWIGYAVLGLLVVRLAWGLVGPPEARFSAFPPSPRAAIAHLADLITGRPRRHASHNPAGALVINAFWALLAVTTATGVLIAQGSPLRVTDQNDALMRGDWAQLARDDHGDDGILDLAEDLHEGAANLIVFLAFLHVAGVLVEGRLMRTDLLRPMLLGRKKDAP